MSFTESVEDLVARNPNGLLSAHATWSRVPLNLVFDVQNGFPFESRHFNSSGEGMPLLRIRDIVPGSTETYYSKRFDDVFVVNRGDILIGMDGDFACRAWRGTPALLNQRVCRLRPTSDRYSPVLLAHVLQGYLDAINAKTSAITVKHLSSRTIEDIPLPLPPSKEQGRIVEAIESYLTRLDDAVASLERVHAKLKAYRASVLKAAVEGRLVPTEAFLARADNRAYEPAEALLARVLKERRRRWEEAKVDKLKVAGKTPKDDKWKVGYKEPAAPNLGTLPALPEGWCWGTWERVADRVTVGHVGEMKNEYRDEGVPFLRGQNVKANEFDPRGLKYVSELFHRRLGKSALQSGDLLIVRSGDVGTACVVPDRMSGANCSDLVIVKQPRAVLPRFGAYYMNSLAKKTVRSQQVGIALTHFNTKSAAALPVPIPPMHEQERIVETVDDLLSVVGKLATGIALDLARCQRLRQAVLKWAFEGKLVDQDPTDEPAERLLARIRAERVASAKMSGGRRAKGAA